MEKIGKVTINSSPSSSTPLIQVEVQNDFTPEATWQQQQDFLADKHLLGNGYHLPLHTITIGIDFGVKFIDEAIIAGSSLSNLFNSTISANDVDIYFHTIEQAEAFARVNDVHNQVRWNLRKNPDQLKYCAWVTKNARKYNLIWGIEYKDIDDLILGFDIRAAAIGYHPDGYIRAVQGAISDCIGKNLVFQPSARNANVERLLKYVAAKNFTIDKYQRAMFGELIRSGTWNADNELNTGYNHGR